MDRQPSPDFFGAIVGSFLNVVAYRLPRHESLVDPGVALPGVRHAGQALRQHPDPLLAAAARPLPQLRRRRSRRATRSSRRSPPLLCAGAVLAHDIGRRHRAGRRALILVVVPVALIDLEHRIIPNRSPRRRRSLALALGLALDPSASPSG